MASASFPNDPDTTFVQTDPETFRAVVQRLTGAAAGSHGSGKFNLHERRPAAKKLKITLHNHSNGGAASLHSHSHSHSPAATSNHHRAVMASPVSPLEYYAERAIAEKGFYFHPNPFSSPARSDPPQLLPLFPLHSPRGKESYMSI